MPDFKKIEVEKKWSPVWDFVENYFPISIVYFFESIYNLIKWFPTIWRQRDFDHLYLYEIIEKKIEFQRKAMNRYSYPTLKEDERYIDICLDLIKKVKNEFYSSEYLDYRSIESITEGKITRFKVKNQNNSGYLKKYPSVSRKIRDKYPEIEESTLCYFVAKENHKRAKSLLFRIISEKSGGWWF